MNSNIWRQNKYGKNVYPWLKTGHNEDSTKNNLYPQWETEYNKKNNLDSIALWSDYIFVTSKNKHKVYIYNIKGDLIETIGSYGSGEYQFKRPNGIFTIDDILFVVERDNKRIQLFNLPDLKFIKFIGEGILKKPYGINGYKNNYYHVYVTDDEDKVVYKFTLDGKLNYTYTSFGDFEKTESIVVDPYFNRVLVADEIEKNIKVFDLNGKYEKNILEDYFKGEPEGIVSLDDIYIFVDQHKNKNRFLVVGKDLNFVTSFYSDRIQNTDGIAANNEYLYAIHDDGGLSCIDMSEITKLY
jgi:3-phytase